MNSYTKRTRYKLNRETLKIEVRQEMDKYAEHFDLCMLWTLHLRGYGAKRLREFYHDFTDVFNEFKRRYYDPDDMKVFGERGDTYMLKERLKKIGFDYDKEVKELVNERAD